MAFIYVLYIPTTTILYQYQCSQYNMYPLAYIYKDQYGNCCYIFIYVYNLYIWTSAHSVLHFSCRQNCNLTNG